jgi:hypothetical protein
MLEYRHKTRGGEMERQDPRAVAKAENFKHENQICSLMLR